MAEQRVFSFEETLEVELDEISSSRRLRNRREPVPSRESSTVGRAHGATLVGLAFSGGGIRSATFNLGILQALAKLGLLRRFDYLSTVSGGGYIGSWLGAWILRRKLAAVEFGLFPKPVAETSAREDDAIHFLRQYSNYLTPRLGMFSGDTWTMVSIYLRNLLLNQAVLVLALAALLLLPRVLVSISAGLPDEFALIAALGLLGLATVYTVRNLAAFSISGTYPRHTCPGRVQALILIPIVAAAWLASCTLKQYGGALDAEFATTVVTPGLLLLLWLLGVAAIGLRGGRFPDGKREWLSRLGAWLLIYSLAWTFVFGMAIYIPPAIAWLDQHAWTGLARLGLGPAWLLSTIGGLLAGRSAATGERGSNRLLEFVAQAAPYVFIAGLLALVSFAIHSFAPDGALVSLLLAAGFAGAALLLSSRVDVNEFSMHNFYRNRLVRGYLGASNTKRRPHPFTGFSSGDDELPLHALSPSKGYQGPYPIINGTLNLTHSEELAWQQRKAASFTFSPRFCGTEVAPGKPATDACRRESDLASKGYRRTEEYAYPKGGGIFLGTALAISGAAACPNMGFHTSAPVALLMTVFNVRLGWWLSNPRHEEAWQAPGPRYGLLYLFGELFGSTSDRSRYVYLSDGGHFENLGIYELVRRRCRFIVACDGSEDRKFHFDGLGNAIEKCRADFNIPIEIDFEQIRPQQGARQSRWHCAVGKIRYDLADYDAPVGTLLYIKSSLTGDEPGDLNWYAAGNENFPHEPTADQWFDESQFESYRALGYHIGRSVFDAAGNGRGLASLSTEELFLALREHWYPPSSAAARSSFTRHAAALDRLVEIIRGSGELTFMDAQIYPEWEELMTGAADPPAPQMWLPRQHAERRAGFYICNQMIQLMEDVYLDLELEKEHCHPDNRGWMNLFQHWAWSGMFRVTWAITAPTYGARFQNFCSRHLGLEVRKSVLIGPPLRPAEADQQDTFNFFEKELLQQFISQNPHLRAELVYPLRIAVADPMRKTEDVAFQYTFGFALAGSAEGRKSLLYLRVQNHLRKMGLAREALAALIGKLGITTTEPGKLERDDEEAVSAAQQRRFKQLFEAVKYEIGAEKPL